MANISNPRIASILKDHVLRPYNQGDFTAESWRKCPEIPSSAEILGQREVDDLDQEDEQALRKLYGVSPEEQPGLPLNLVGRPWDNPASYIGAHYQLLREDSVYPLRKAVAEVQADPTMKDSSDTAIYTHVHIVGLTLCNQGVGVKVEFSYENAGKRIRWEHSSRLRQGTIVALTPRNDMFNTICKVAVVAARPLANGVELNPPRVDLYWARPEEAEFDPTINWVMVESRSGYWEAFRHMGVALQKLRSESFPLFEYLAGHQPKVDPPKHIQSNPHTNMTSLLPDAPVCSFDEYPEGDPEFENVDILQTWPEMSSSLDASQLQATNRILTKKVAIVQGPPGTGKTFVSITALKVMLHTFSPEDPPIIISAQTNHALDQLLLQIAPYVPDFIRLGGRTADKSGVIKKRTLYEVRQLQGTQGSSNRNTRNAMDNVRKEIWSLLNLLVEDLVLTGEQLLALGIITEEQFNSLHNETWVDACDPNALNAPQGDIVNWVGFDQMCTLQSKCPPINDMLLEEEEELEDQYEHLNEDEAESKLNTDDDIEKLKGDYHELKQSWTGERSTKWSLKKTTNLLKSHSDLWEIPDDCRGEIYIYFIAQAKKLLRQNFRHLCKEYERCVANDKIGKWEKDARMIVRLKTKVIGCTTTGLSKYRGLLAALQPRTLLIEEAAETVEGTVLAAIFESLDHLILVGDHQQLQPKPNRADLSMHPYNLSISMFERLVKKIEHTMLNKQRRMIPEIRETFTHIYKGEGDQEGLSDHHSVLDRAANRPPVSGTTHDLYWFQHVWPESTMDTSKCNFDEAEMVVNFFDYLFLNDVDPSKISILTFYTGQKKVLQKLLRKHPNLRAVTNFNVFTVDSYQGEENDIILLSMVRSNNFQENGFLAIQNRAVVSLSRARRGLYVFGNSYSLVSNNITKCYDTWSKILMTFYTKRIVGGMLPLECKNHGNTPCIKTASDFDIKRLAGGCEMKCGGTLPCGHDCTYSCHPFDHERVLCKEPCTEILACGHVCNQNCGDACFCLQCLPLTELEPQSYTSAADSAGCSGQPHEDIAETFNNLSNLPSQAYAGRSVRNGNSISHTSNMSSPAGNPSNSRHIRGVQQPTTNGYHGNSIVPASWGAGWDPRASDRAANERRRAEMALAMSDPSRANAAGIVDDFRQVTLDNKAERSAPKKSVTKEISLNTRCSSSHAPVSATTATALVAPVPSREMLRTNGVGETSVRSSSHRPVQLQHENSYTPYPGPSNLPLGGSMRNGYIQPHDGASLNLLGDDFASASGIFGNAVQVARPIDAFVPRIASTNHVTADDEDLIQF